MSIYSGILLLSFLAFHFFGLPKCLWSCYQGNRGSRFLGPGTSVYILMTRILITAIMGMIVCILVGGTEQNRYLSLLLFVNWYCDSFLENFGKLCSRIFFCKISLRTFFEQTCWTYGAGQISEDDPSLYFIWKLSSWIIFWKVCNFCSRHLFLQNILMNLFLRSIVGRTEQDRYLRMIHPSPKGIDSFVQKHQHKERLEIYK